jgi:hypothetical protein
MDTINKSGSRNPITNAVNLVKTTVDKYIVRPMGGRGSTGINGFVFDIVDEESMYLDSEITDHYVENNYAIQDHIARRPERFVLRGFVGELTDIFPNTFLGVLTGIQSLASIGGFLPEFSAQATQEYAKIAAKAAKVGQVVNQARNIYDMFFSKSTTATKQQNAYKYFYDMWQARTLCSVETPFGLMENMAIESLRAIQHGDTRFVSDFSVTFKMIRTTNTVTAQKVSLGRAADMVSKAQNNGVAAGRDIGEAIAGGFNADTFKFGGGARNPNGGAGGTF